MKLAAVCERDILLDTNILSHADNPASSHQASAIEILMWLAESNVNWVLDDQGKAAPDLITSLLWAEYNSTLAPQSLGLVVLNACISGTRVRFASRPGQADRNSIRKMIPRNKRDQAILGATINSKDKVLVSNDEDDFSSDVREKAAQTWGTKILLSEEAAEPLS